MDESTGLPLSFGKRTAPKKQADPSRVHNTKRSSPPPAPSVCTLSSHQQPPPDVGAPSNLCIQQSSLAATPVEQAERPIASCSVESPVPGRSPPQADGASSEPGSDLPITHEVVMKDHNKVGNRAKRGLMSLSP